MKYLLMIYSDEVADMQQTEAQNARIFQEYGAFTQAVESAGAYKGGDALQPTNTAVTIRVRDGKLLKTDGPFAETKEQLGGFYLLDCKSLDEAVQWASKIPHAKLGSIEVRPIMDFSQTASA